MPATGDSTTPIRRGGTPASASAAATASAASAADAINSPPEVCGSYSSHSNSAATPGSTRTAPAKWSWFVPRPPDRLRLAMSSTPVKSGTQAASTTSVAPPARAAVGENPRGIDRSGDGVPEFDFLILDGVAAKQRDARFAQLVESAAKDFADGLGLEALFRERGDRERGQRPAAHRVDVADGV